MDLCNYHSHCDFCDGKAPAEAFVKAAIAAGFHSYGISSHSPLPFRTSWSLDREDVPAYLKEVERLKKAYAHEIELYVGMEIDYLSDSWNPSIAYFQELPLDYRIGSVHFVENGKGEIMDMDGPFDEFRQNLQNLFKGDLKRLVEAYFEASMRMVEAGGFDFIAHADKIAMNASLVDNTITETPWYGEKIRDYFALIAEKGIMVEVNTKAYRRLGIMFPNRRYFKWLNDLGIRFLVNSDSHLPDLVNDGRALAFEWLREAGVKTTVHLHEGKWEEVPISI